MKKLLVTGFEPFGGEAINPAWEAVSRLPDQIGAYALTKLRVPTVFGKAGELAIKKAEEICANAVLCIGQAGGRAAVTPELAAINVRDARIPDNAGQQPCDEPVVAGAPDAYFSTLPVRRMTDAIQKAGLPGVLSYSAGAYVCNDLLFMLLHRFADTAVRVAFIHVPYLPEQTETQPSMPLSDILRALTAAISAID
ncbi:MAG: pyroglutamyl-peptidase I [Clostridiales bacterium]|nr:pyroglutamyl-peptidase I [Clostridiales bacterium]